MRTPPRLARLEELIARAANVSIDLIRSRTRDRAIVDARQAIWYVAHEHMGYTYPLLARVYERDHTTIISGVSRLKGSKAAQTVLEGVRQVDPELLEQAVDPGQARTLESWRFEK